ncbi:Uncharacterised protein [Vibrio cholerae]|nr:Uncharacterised protein [Vibrio cholerae]
MRRARHSRTFHRADNDKTGYTSAAETAVYLATRARHPKRLARISVVR